MRINKIIISLLLLIASLPCLAWNSEQEIINYYLPKINALRDQINDLPRMNKVPVRKDEYGRTNLDDFNHNVEAVINKQLREKYTADHNALVEEMNRELENFRKSKAERYKREKAQQRSQQEAIKKANIRERQRADIEKANARMEAYREELRRRAEEKRRKIEEQNRKDRERGHREYQQQMGGFHAALAERDAYMATEGMAKLRNMHPMDMASIPEAKREDKLNMMSGSDMANLLKDKKEEKKDITITVVIRKRNLQREKTSDFAIEDASTAIDMYDGGGYNFEDEDSWDREMTSIYPTITLPQKMAQVNDYTKLVLFKKSQLDISQHDLATLPGMGCVILMGDSLLLLDDNELPILNWGLHRNVEEVTVCGSRTFAKIDNKIVEITPGSTTDVLTLETEDFHLYPESERSLVVKAVVGSLTIVARVNVENKKYDEILRVPQQMQKIEANSKVVLALSGSKIIDITGDPDLFYSAPSPINDMVMCEEGLLVASDKNILLLKSPEDVSIFCKEGAKRLWYDGDDIYAQDLKDNLVRYSKINNKQQ